MRPPRMFCLNQKSLLLQWEADTPSQAHKNIIACCDWITDQFADEIIDLMPTYNELAVYVKTPETLRRIGDALQGMPSEVSVEINTATTREITIPVCYAGDFGLDIEHVAALHNCTVNEVIARHAEVIYTVSFIGFLPGFPYVTGLPDQLVTPRRQEPRSKIAAGSVGIGGDQTGIYPQDSPGGWNIIGRTPVALFNPNMQPSSVFRAGDLLRFESISKEKYDQIVREIANGTFTIKISYYD